MYLSGTNSNLGGESHIPKHKRILRLGAPCLRDMAHHSAERNSSRGFSVLELLTVLTVGTILTAMAIPAMTSALAGMRLNSTVGSITAAISQTRSRAIMNSQPYTLVLTVPSDTYVVTNVTTSTADSAVSLPNSTVSINGGTAGTYTYTLCPNGTIYGAGGTCPGANLPPALTAAYRGKLTDINVSSVGNVTATIVH